MNVKINNQKDLYEFIEQIINEGVSFHPDDDFRDVINFNTGKKIYSESAADIRNNLLDQSFSVCQRDGLDLYDLTNDILKKHIELTR
ncbi:MAG: hypothetical protein M0Q51_04140 [Bacteroidales bacterium]|nr:hypothetical protein [Bacteroidales bacterium]